MENLIILFAQSAALIIAGIILLLAYNRIGKLKSHLEDVEFRYNEDKKIFAATTEMLLKVQGEQKTSRWLVSTLESQLEVANNKIKNYRTINKDYDASLKRLVNDRFVSFLSPIKKVSLMIEVSTGIKPSSKKVNLLVKEFNNFDKPIAALIKDIIVDSNTRDKFLAFIKEQKGDTK